MRAAADALPAGKAALGHGGKGKARMGGIGAGDAWGS